MTAKKNVGKNAAEPAPKKTPTKAQNTAKKAATKKRRDDQKLTALENSLKALDLRKAGYTYDKIARAIGYTNGGAAYKAVQRAMKEVLREPVKELKEMELARLDELQNSIWMKAITGSEKAIDAVMKIMARRAKLLGMDQDNLNIDAKGTVQLIWDAKRILPAEKPPPKKKTG